MTPFWNLSYDMSYPRWVYKIDSAGWSINYRNTALDELGDQTPCTNHPEYNEYEGYRNSTYFMIGE